MQRRMQQTRWGDGGMGFRQELRESGESRRLVLWEKLRLRSRRGRVRLKRREVGGTRTAATAAKGRRGWEGWIERRGERC